MKQGSPERAKIRTNTDIVALSWGFPYHKCIFHSIVSQTPPCKAIKVKSQLLQLQAMNSQDESTHLAMIHTSIFASCASNGAAALVPSSAPGRLLPSLPPPASPRHVPSLPQPLPHRGSSSHQTTGCGSQQGDYRSFTLNDPDMKEFNPAFEVKSIYLPFSSESLLKHLILSHHVRSAIAQEKGPEVQLYFRPSPAQREIPQTSSFALPPRVILPPSSQGFALRLKISG